MFSFSLSHTHTLSLSHDESNFSKQSHTENTVYNSGEITRYTNHTYWRRLFRRSIYIKSLHTQTSTLARFFHKYIQSEWKTNIHKLLFCFLIITTHHSSTILQFLISHTYEKQWDTDSIQFGLFQIFGNSKFEFYTYFRFFQLREWEETNSLDFGSNFLLF